MHNTIRDDQADLPDALLEEAAIWQARLRDVANLDSAEERAARVRFTLWLETDARHRQAFEEMQSLWSVLEIPVAQAMSESPTRNVFMKTPASPLRCDLTRTNTKLGSVLRLAPRLAVAAPLVVALLVGFGWQQDWPTRWQSDYQSAIGEQVLIDMEDGSRITLNTHSALASHYTTKQRKVRLLRGEAWFEVSSGDERPFIVETAQGDVKVTGTRFNIRLTANAAVVSLDEGALTLYATGAPGVAPKQLAPGLQVSLSDLASEPVAFDRTAVTGWLRGQFVFYNTPLAEVVSTLNRYRQGRIVVTGDELKSLKVSGIFSTRDTDAALAVVTSTLPVQQTRFTNYLVLLR